MNIRAVRTLRAFRRPEWTCFPQGLLARVRWLFLMVCWVQAVQLLPAILAVSHRPLAVRLAATGALVWLCSWWTQGYRR